MSVGLMVQSTLNALVRKVTRYGVAKYVYFKFRLGCLRLISIKKVMLDGRKFVSLIELNRNSYLG